QEGTLVHRPRDPASREGQMNILGIDPGLNVTGWAVITAESSKRRLVATGSIRSAKYGQRPEQLQCQHRGIREVINAYQPDVAGVELFRYQGERSHSRDAFEVSRLVGRLEGLLIELGIEVIDGIDKNVANRACGLVGKVSPARIKAAVERM